MTLLDTFLQPTVKRAGEYAATALLGTPTPTSSGPQVAQRSMLIPELQPRALPPLPPQGLVTTSAAVPAAPPAAPPAGLSAVAAGVAAAPAARPPLVQLLQDHWPLLVLAGVVIGGGVLLWRYWEPGAVASREARRMAELERADRLLRRGPTPTPFVPPRRRRRIADGSV